MPSERDPDEVGRLLAFEERHRRLLGRLGIVLAATALLDACGTVAIYGRVFDVLELWAVIVVAGSAGAIGAFFQNADSSR